MKTYTQRRQLRFFKSTWFHCNSDSFWKLNLQIAFLAIHFSLLAVHKWKVIFKLIFCFLRWFQHMLHKNSDPSQHLCSYLLFLGSWQLESSLGWAQGLLLSSGTVPSLRTPMGLSVPRSEPPPGIPSQTQERTEETDGNYLLTQALLSLFSSREWPRNEAKLSPSSVQLLLFLASFPGLNHFCSSVSVQYIHSSATMYYTECKPKNKTGEGLGTRLPCSPALCKQLSLVIGEACLLAEGVCTSYCKWWMLCETCTVIYADMWEMAECCFFPRYLHMVCSTKSEKQG